MLIPVWWVVDRAGSGALPTSLGGAMFGFLVGWVMDGVISVTGTIVGSFAHGVDPNVTAEWFVQGADGRLGPYAMSAKIGAVLLVVFVLAGVTHGVLTADVTGMVKRVLLHLPMAVLGTVALGGVTHLGVQVVDALSTWVLTTFDADLHELADALSGVARAASTGGTGGGGFVVLLVGILAAVAGLIVVAELVVRSALVYLVVALGPLAFAAALWPPLRGVARKLLELLGALVASKLVIALALAVAAAALTGTDAVGPAAGDGGFAIPPPGPGAGGTGGDSAVDAGTGGGDVPTAESIGVLLAGAAAFGVAAFSPMLVVGLFGLTAGATVGQGVRQMPLRGVQRGARAAGSVARLAAAPTRAAATGGAAGTHLRSTLPAPSSVGAARVANGSAAGGRPGGNRAAIGDNGSRPQAGDARRPGAAAARDDGPSGRRLGGNPPPVPPRSGAS